VVVAGLVPFVVLTLIVLGTAFSLVAWQPPVIQTLQFGTTNSENGITAMTSDLTGIYATGFVGYRNATPTYLFLNKYDLNARQVWMEHFDNPYSSTVAAIAVGTEGVYTVGSTNGSSYIRRYDVNGGQIWNLLFRNWSVSSISVTTTGVYVVGNNSTQYVVREYYPNGTVAWSRLFGNGSGDVYVYSGLEGVYAIGEQTIATTNGTGTGVVEKYTLDGTSVWSGTCSCDATGIAGDSTSVYVLGTVQIASSLSDGFVLKYDSGGDQLWNRTFSAPGYNSVERVKGTTDSSGIYLASTTTGDGGILMNYDGNGNLVWSRQLPFTSGSGLARDNTLAVARSSLYIGGSYGGAVTNIAFLTLIDKSSSLIFFGVNPPYSFGVVGLLIAVSVVSIIWFRRRWKKEHSPTKSGRDRSQKTRTDKIGVCKQLVFLSADMHSNTSRSNI